MPAIIPRSQALRSDSENMRWYHDAELVFCAMCLPRVASTLAIHFVDVWLNTNLVWRSASTDTKFLTRAACSSLLCSMT